MAKSKLVGMSAHLAVTHMPNQREGPVMHEKEARQASGVVSGSSWNREVSEASMLRILTYELHLAAWNCQQ
ncbi:hypothetical protein PI125_g10924 [Phytophthora idaei]|nr:hypothetical protein PI125_g10924 [Phytophthora idaei]